MRIDLLPSCHLGGFTFHEISYFFIEKLRRPLLQFQIEFDADFSGVALLRIWKGISRCIYGWFTVHLKSLKKVQFLKTNIVCMNALTIINQQYFYCTIFFNFWCTLWIDSITGNLTTIYTLLSQMTPIFASSTTDIYLYNICT